MEMQGSCMVRQPNGKAMLEYQVSLSFQAPQALAIFCDNLQSEKHCDGCQIQILHFFTRTQPDISEISLSIYKKLITPIQILRMGTFDNGNTFLIQHYNYEIKYI